MKRLGGIVCCLFLILASAAWALEKCQSLAAHHDDHAPSVNVTYPHGIDLPLHQSLPEDPVIHCADLRDVPSFISQPLPRLGSSTVVFHVLPSSFVPVSADANGWINYRDKRPPGSFLSAISPYLSLSVLRI